MYKERGQYPFIVIEHKERGQYPFIVINVNFKGTDPYTAISSPISFFWEASGYDYSVNEVRFCLGPGSENCSSPIQY